MTYRSDIEALAARKVALDAEIKARTKERDEAEAVLKEAVEKLRLPMLDNITIASPCKANWSNMRGDERVRHCTRCDQKVYDLSAMTRDEAEQLIREKNGNLCARYYKRVDGTIMTADCPQGLRGRRVAFAVVATAFGAGAVLAGARIQERQVMGSIGAPSWPHDIATRHIEAAKAQRRSAPATGVGESEIPIECEQYLVVLRALTRSAAKNYDEHFTKLVDRVEESWLAIRTDWHWLSKEQANEVRTSCSSWRASMEHSYNEELRHRDRDRSDHGNQEPAPQK